MKCSVIIVAAGSSQRCGGETPKQFVEVAGLPLVMHTVHAFEGEVDEIVVVVPAQGGVELWQRLVEKYSLSVAHKVVEGAGERFFSVKNGLSAVDPTTEVVMVQDGVRPFVSGELIGRMKSAVHSADAAVPVVPVADTLRKVGGGVLSRSEVMAVQTPQAFRYEILMKSYTQPYNEKFTDDGSVVEAAGYEVEMVEGDSANFKITTPADMIIAQKLIETN